MNTLKNLMAGIVAIGLMTGVSAQSAKAEPITIIVGVGVVAGVFGYLVGHHFMRHDDCGGNCGAEVVPAMKYRPNSNLNAATRCQSQYKSYDPRTGLITLDNGQKKICPYLQ